MAQTDGEQERLRARLEAKLQPERIRATLAFAGLYQITNELIENAVVEDVRQFYFRGFDETGFLYDEERYRAQVRSRHRNKFRASVLWLVDSGAISLAQADRLTRIHE